jgi:hypothetical protein
MFKAFTLSFVLLLSTSLFAKVVKTALNPENVLGLYDMKGIVHLKANILPNNIIEATQIGIFSDTQCEGTYNYLLESSIVEATLDCEGERLFQKIDLSGKYLEDLIKGTKVNVYLEYKEDKYNFDFKVIKVEPDQA